MKYHLGGISLLAIALGSNLSLVGMAQETGLFLAYPPSEHQTTASQIFLIGTAKTQGEVLVNGKPIQQSKAGHFAPNFPLNIGDNQFVIRQGNQELRVNVTRVATTPTLPSGVAFAPDSLQPNQDIVRLPGELICFSAIAPPDGEVSVRLANQTIPLFAQAESVQLPTNGAVLTNQNQASTQRIVGQYQGCSNISRTGNLGKPEFQVNFEGKIATEIGQGNITIVDATNLEVIEVTVPQGVARTGPSSDYSRLTPLPQGTRATVTGKEGEWLRLDYGGWIKQSETTILPHQIPPQAIIRGLSSREIPGATEVIFPLQTPIPVTIWEGEQTLTVNLHNTVAQTDTIYLGDNPLIKRLDWQQITPNQVQYTFNLTSKQQWGYSLRYEGSNLILTLRHPPQINQSHPLQNQVILLDPGHGGKELGSRGATGYPEKDVNLIVSKLVQQELTQRGAKVYMTRDTDVDVSLNDRVAMIEKVQPAIALSIHYNALPDGGDAINTSGIGAFWYHTQAHDLAQFLHNYLVKKLNRPSYGVYWNNLALTRPAISPSVLLELGFMINPEEFEWITNGQEQKQLASAIADALAEWLESIE